MPRRRQRRGGGGFWIAVIIVAVILTYAHGSIPVLSSIGGPSGSGSCSGIGSVPASMINGAAQQVGISCRIVRAQINEESGGSPGAVSPAGALGAAQVMPNTWASDCPGPSADAFIVSDAMNCYVIIMKQDMSANGGNVTDALAAYNAGQGNLGAGMGYADTIMSAAG